MRQLGRFILVSLIGIAAATSTYAARIFLHQIEIEGVSIFKQNSIEGALEVAVGDELERAAVLETVQNIESMYQSKGFEKVQVGSRLVRRSVGEKTLNVMVFTVVEGKPSRIASFRIVPTDIVTDESKQVWSKLEGQLSSQVKFDAGEVFETETVSDAARDLESTLTSLEYFGAQLRDVRVQTASLEDKVPREFKNSTERWVTLEFVVDLGDKVSFGFRGNKIFNRNELSQLIEELRLIGFGKDYIEEIRAKIIQKYLEVGHANVNVQAKTFERPSRQERHVSFVIEEGERVKILEVGFDGNIVFDDQKLREVFLEQAPPQIQKGYYVEADVEGAAGQLIDWVKSRGYLSAKLITISRVYADQEKRRLRLTLVLYEGEQTIVGSIKYPGLDHFEKERVNEILGVEEGAPLNLFKFSEGLEVLKAEYRNQGFLEFQILNEDKDNVIRYLRKNRVANINVELKESHQFRVSRIVVEGLTKTFPHIAKRELRFGEGDVLELWRVAESEQRLRKLGIFGAVKIQHRTDPARPDHKEVRVLLQEGTPGLVEGGAGIRNDLGIRVFGTAAYTNIWHRNHTVALTGSANRRFEDFCVGRSQEPICFIEYQFRIGYIWPWFLVEELKFRPQITQQLRRYNQFDAQTTSFQAIFERPLLERTNLVGLFTYNLELTRQFNAKVEVDNQTLRIGSVIPALRLDLRDSPLSPTNGFFASASYEIASTILGSQESPVPVGYHKIQYRADQHIPIYKKIVGYVSFRTGLVRNMIDPLSVEDKDNKRNKVGVPLIKQFALGGPGSMRGFKLQEMNFQEKIIQGDLSFVNYRAQIDFPITGPMRVGPFLDAGNLMVDAYSLGQDMRYSAGFGIHYLTPVGPVNFDWGFKLNRRPKDQSGQEFHFTVGIL